MVSYILYINGVSDAMEKSAKPDTLKKINWDSLQLAGLKAA